MSATEGQPVVDPEPPMGATPASPVKIGDFWPKDDPSAAEMIRYCVAAGMEAYSASQVFIDEGRVFDIEVRHPLHLLFMAATARIQHNHDVVALLRRLRDLDAAAADEMATFVWNAADAGDSYGEWLWDWAKEAGLDPAALDAMGATRGRLILEKNLAPEDAAIEQPSGPKVVDVGASWCVTHQQVVRGDADACDPDLAAPCDLVELGYVLPTVPDPHGPVYRRTPIVTIELPLWPTPPADASPWWWGLHDLTFRAGTGDDRAKVWEGRVPEAGHGSRSSKVRWVDGSGWVVSVTLTHEKAKAVLDGLDMRHVIEPTAAHQEAGDA